VKVESYVVEAGTDRRSPSWGEGGFAGSSNRWWMLMTGVVVRVSVLSVGGGGVGKLNTEGRCEAIGGE
jgi:hypothetical protein